MKLVIVESPAKAKTIGKFLGSDFVVESSIGHIRDLPKSAADIPADMKKEKWTRLGVDVENDFEPLYVISPDKKKHVKKLQDLLKKAKELYLATDEDREGEAISWHLMEVLKPKVPVKRLAFHEITEEAINNALNNPRKIDMHLVNAQETRRVLDRLYGYEVSPILWRKIRPKLSAGRVQSVAVKIIVDRERDRIRFIPCEYFSLVADFITVGGEQFQATLKELGGKRVALGKDFDLYTGKLKGSKVLHLEKKQAEGLAVSFKKNKWSIKSIEDSPMKSSPYAPFITSTLQQEANKRFGFSSRHTMSIAQQLYEHGYITYMRTDSVSLSGQAINAARKIVEKEFGAQYLSPYPRVYASKVKNAQEAHEAIRPAGNFFRSPVSLNGKIDSDGLKLYKMIYDRTIATQMADAKMRQTTVEIVDDDDKALFVATGRVVEFFGYLKAYNVGRGSGEDSLLPEMKVGERVKMKKNAAEGHSTLAPARYNEASLIKELEAKGIGRPSTYASIIDTILRRGYVYKKAKALVPTFTAFAVVRLLEQFFKDLVDFAFTAEMEEDLDSISRGEKLSLNYLKLFYFGDKKHEGLSVLVKAEIDPKEVCTIPLPNAAKSGINVRIGKFGPYLEKGEKRASLPNDLPPDELTESMAKDLFTKTAVADKPIGEDPETKKPIYVKVGRFGPYVQLGEPGGKEKPKMKGLPKGLEVGAVDFATALKILELPKIMGQMDGVNVVADIGRFGSYLRCGEETRSLKKDDFILDLTLKRAIEILKTPKAARGKGGKRGGSSKSRVKKSMRDFKEDVTIKIYDGRYGPYASNGKVNVSLPKGEDPEKITFEEIKKLIDSKS